MVFLSPAFVLIALSTIFTSGTGRVDLLLWDQDRTSISRQFVSTLTSDEDFSVEYAADYAEIERKLVQRRVEAGLIIPPGFGDTVGHGASATVQVVLDGVDTSVANRTMGSLRGHAQDFSRALSRQVNLAPVPLEVHTRSAYLPDANRQDSMVVGLIPIVFSLPIIAAAVALAREHESGSLESLITTPVRGLEYLGGKLIAYVTTALGGLAPVWVAVMLLFGVPLRGSPFLLIATTLEFLLASIGMALFLGNVVHSQQTATVIALFVFFVPSFFLAGLIDPLDRTNLLSTAVAYAMPSTHFITICRAIFLKGATLLELWQPAIALLALALAWVGLGALTFKKRVA
jgi:ABC-2 type transport system permease protein